MSNNANEHNNIVTLIGELISKVSDWEGVLPVCLTIIGVIMWAVISVFLCNLQPMLDKYINLLIYGFFMTIVFLFLIPISEKVFVYKLYEEINKQETNRQNAEVQIYTATLEHLTAKNLSKEDIDELIYTINDCLNNDTDLKERLVTLIDISKQCLSENQKDKQVLKDAASKLCNAIQAYLHNSQKGKEEKLKNEIADSFKEYLAALKST